MERCDGGEGTPGTGALDWGEGFADPDWEASALAYLEANRERHLGQLMEFLAIPSVSTLPEHRDDVRRAIQWVADHLSSLGFTDVAVWETGGHPSAYGQWVTDPALPTVLVYGHADVQPADPEDAWLTPPFQPVLQVDRIVARGASDNKGGLFLPLKAVEALMTARGRLPVNVKVLIEGEEEILSPHLPELLTAKADQLACDLVVSADGCLYQKGRPSLRIGMRGFCALEVEVVSLASDAHSGVFGGAVRNPIQALVTLLSTLHGPDGAVAVSGFYDDVRPLSPKEREQLAQVLFREADVLAQLGAVGPYGEKGYSTVERLWARPTLEFDGIGGGFQGEGVKTVIPARARAKISCRIVPDQDPHKVLAAIQRHLHSQNCEGVRLHTRPIGGVSFPFVLDPDSPPVRIAADVLRSVYGEHPVYTRWGGSIPAAEQLQRTLGVPVLIFAFADPDNLFHAPNEFFRLGSLERGLLAYVRLFLALGSRWTDR